MEVLHTMQFRSTISCIRNAIKTPLKPFSIDENLRTKPVRAFSALQDGGQNQNKNNNNKKTKPSAKSEAFREKLKNAEGNGRLDWITEPSVQRLIAELDDEGNKKSKKKGKAAKYYYERKGEDDYNDDDLVVEEEDESWWSDDLEYAEERWRPRASEYFKEPKIRNVIDENGRMIDWLGESNDEIIQEITSMEYEATAYHPSPLIILVFERYQRISENWDTLKELEKAFKVYWHSPEKLPPRIVKVDSKIDPDLASALGVKYPPQILFLGGKKILYREAESRTADQLVKMIAHFYYNAKRPDWINLAYYNR